MYTQCSDMHEQPTKNIDGTSHGQGYATLTGNPGWVISPPSGQSSQTTVTPHLIGIDSLMRHALISTQPSTCTKKERRKRKKGKNRQYSLTRGIHQVASRTHYYGP
jgi:hypothetical protein